nr:MAG TPA: hypothetical protein [Bacteriophage sp.]
MNNQHSKINLRLYLSKGHSKHNNLLCPPVQTSVF